MTHRRVMTLALAVVLSTLAAPGARAQTDTLSAVFEAANALYENGDYDEAIESYGRLVTAGVRNPDLYYNLGNACYKVGDIGRSILYYERARRLAPRGEDIAENLSLARSLLRDRQFVDESGWLRNVVMWPHDHLSTRETFLLMSAFYLLFTVAVLGLIFRDSSLVARAYPALSMASPGRLLGLDKVQDFVLAICTALLLTLATGASAYAKYHEETERSRGVVVQEEVAVYGGPSDDATLQFKIHEGTVVRIRDERTRWVQVRLPGGLSGWTHRESIERI